MKRAATLMLLSLALLLVLMLASCQRYAARSNAPVLRAIGELRTSVTRLDSSYRAFNLNYSRHVQAQIDSTVRRYSDDEMEREIKRFTDPTKKY